MVKTVSEFMSQVYQHSNHPQRRILYPSCGRHQLLELVCDGLRIPIPHQEAELWLVEQVQLCDECSSRQRDSA